MAQGPSPPPRTPTQAGLTPSATRARKRTREGPPLPLQLEPYHLKLSYQPDLSATAVDRYALYIHSRRRNSFLIHSYPLQPVVTVVLGRVNAIYAKHGRRRSSIVETRMVTCIVDAHHACLHGGLFAPLAIAVSVRHIGIFFGIISASACTLFKRYHDVCLTNEAVQCIQSLHQALDKEQMVTCDYCHERSFTRRPVLFEKGLGMRICTRRGVLQLFSTNCLNPSYTLALLGQHQA